MIEYEAMGPAAPGEGGKLAREGQTARGGRLPINLSGGLKLKGHPIGATCVSTHVVAAMPEIFNTDQGSQFTSEAFTGVPHKQKIAIGMDGNGAWRDNVFVERLRRSMKYEEVYLKAYDTVAEARSSPGRYLDFYNQQRPHSSFDRRTPNEADFYPTPIAAAA